VKIVLGVAGGVAAFKMASVASRLVQSGYEVDVVLTQAAEQFVGAATFAALAGRAPARETFDLRYPLGAHIELAEKADLLVIAPATARIIASCALGLGDDLLATLYLARTCPVIVAPAMNNAMWEQPAVQRNVRQLQSDGVEILGPASGWLSCRKQGPGRMVESDEIIAAVTRRAPLV
jgi:phosphopantothenoylcysteine decarboxylase/phosphopantothenate--cysteine ligase